MIDGLLLCPDKERRGPVAKAFAVLNQVKAAVFVLPDCLSDQCRGLNHKTSSSMASPSMANPTMAIPSMTSMASPSMANPTMASPSMASPTMANPTMTVSGDIMSKAVIGMARKIWSNNGVVRRNIVRNAMPNMTVVMVSRNAHVQLACSYNIQLLQEGHMAIHGWTALRAQRPSAAYAPQDSGHRLQDRGQEIQDVRHGQKQCGTKAGLDRQAQ